MEAVVKWCHFGQIIEDDFVFIVQFVTRVGVAAVCEESMIL